jgi:serine/threonine protein kinase
VKVLDFGAARFPAGGHGRSLSVILKPGYAPEEQYRTHGKQGRWTDVYGLAATFYRCITGQVPPEALDRLEEDTLKRPSELGIVIAFAAERMLMAGLAVRAADRPQSMEAFEEVFLQAGVPSHSIPAQPAPAWTLGNEKAADKLAPSAASAAPAPQNASFSSTKRPSVWWLLLVAAGLSLGGVLLYERNPKLAACWISAQA